MARSVKLPATSRPASPSAVRVSRLPLIGVLILSSLLSLGAGLAVFALLADLPPNQLSQLNLRALSAARERYRGPAFEGAVLAATSQQIVHAIRDPNVLPGVVDEARGRLRLLSTTALGRAQLLALVMLQLERAGEQPQTWWSRLSGHFDALFAAPLDHHLLPFFEAERSAWLAAGLGPRTAAAQSRALAAGHGVFLQLFVAQTQRLSAALRNAGETGPAARCERASRHILRKMLGADGPLELRVPAAALLANVLSATPTATDTEREIAERCRRWRDAARSQIRAARRQPVALRGADPGMSIVESDPGRIVLTPLWLAAGGAGAAVVAIVGAATMLLHRATYRLVSATSLAAIALTIALSCAAVATNYHADGLVHHDLTRLSSDNAGVPRGPMIWAGISVALVIAAGLAAGPRRAGVSRASALTTTALATWLALMLAVLVVYPYARSVLERDPYAQAGASVIPSPHSPEHLALLEALGTWTP